MKTFVLGCLGVAMLLAAPTVANGGIPDFSQSVASSNPGYLFITPAGAGPTLAASNLVITLELKDGAGTPIASYPFQDIWVDDDGNGDILMCAPALADQNTNAAGITTFSGALAGGGRTQAGLRVYVAGMPIANGLLDIEVRSPDYNRDNHVDIVDLGQFAIDYNDPAYGWWCDFNGDGIEDLADLGIFAANHGIGCP